MTSETCADLNAEKVGAAMRLTLQRPKALNALTAGMRGEIGRALASAARDAGVYCLVLRSVSDRAFSAGSDVREVTGTAKSDPAAGAKLFADEYLLNWSCECFSKPTISFIDGMVMGGGVGISLYGTHRVAGERYSFAMPETLIGLFPDVGVCHAFARMPDNIGVYLGLTGVSIGRADAYALGLVTHCIAASEFVEIEALLAEAWPVDQQLDPRHKDPGEGEVMTRSEMIARCFGGATMTEIISRLEAETGPHSDFAKATLALLRKRSPISLAVTLRHIRDAQARDLREVLMMDYRLALRMLARHDFYEGVRAAIIDKDHAPRWQCASIEEVTDAMVETYFTTLGPGDIGLDLVLPTRSEMGSR